MIVKGKIDKLNSFVATDPSYGSDVWCRYEANPESNKPWDAQLLLKKVDEMVHDEEDNFDYHVEGVDFTLFLFESDQHFQLFPDGRFTHYKSAVLKEFTIGADTACIAIGVNDMVDEIKGCKEDWQPACALRTLTDGEIGMVIEGSNKDKLSFIYLNGFLDKDTGYSIENLKDYFVQQLNMKEVVIEKEGNLDKTLDAAKDKAESSAEKTDIAGLDDIEK